MKETTVKELVSVIGDNQVFIMEFIKLLGLTGPMVPSQKIKAELMVALDNAAADSFYEFRGPAKG